MNESSYRRLDVLEIARRVRSGEVTPLEVTEAALASVTELNTKLNAVVLIDAEGARSQARRVGPQAPLAGVPILIKDNNLFVDGWPTTFSSRFYEGSAPRAESHFINRLRAAGAVLIGKTNTPEFASDWTTEPTWRGPTRNPHLLDHSTGGSSGGSAAAVASGMVPAAHGNDSAGSIRVPAAVCGIFGLKPTRGLVPIGPAFPEFAGGLDSEFMLTRTVRDAAAFLDCLAGPEPGGQYRVTKSVPSYLAALDQHVSPLRIGLVLKRPDGSDIDPEIAVAVEAAARLLEKLGHVIVPIAMPYDPRLGQMSEKIYFAETAWLIQRRARELGRNPRRDELEAISFLALDRTRELDVIDYLEARSELHVIASRLDAQLETYDAVLTPTTGETAPPLGELDSRTDRFDYDLWCAQSARFAPFTDIFNATGRPAASVPIGCSRSGLPFGAQIAAAQGRDDLVLQLCDAVSTGNS